MRTIIVFEVGSSRLLYTELGDVATLPQSGGSVILHGARYRVTDVHTAPALYTNDGKVKRTGFDKLVEILTVLYSKPEVVQTLVQSLESIGSGGRDSVTAGGIILPGSGTALEFDDLVYFRLKQLGDAPVNFGDLLKQVHGLLAGSPNQADEDAAATDGDVAGVSAIRLTSEAAS